MSRYIYARKYDSLHLAALDKAGNERTCNYWYVVTSYGATPHTAFRTRAALDQWLEQRGLSLPPDVELPAEGTDEHGFCAINGSYSEATHMSPSTFYEQKGQTTRVMSNGDWVLGILTVDDAGEHVTVHHLNPNAERHVFDWRESQALQDAGEL